MFWWRMAEICCGHCCKCTSWIWESQVKMSFPCSSQGSAGCLSNIIQLSAWKPTKDPKSCRSTRLFSSHVYLVFQFRNQLPYCVSRRQIFPWLPKSTDLAGRSPFQNQPRHSFGAIYFNDDESGPWAGFFSNFSLRAEDDMNIPLVWEENPRNQEVANCQQSLSCCGVNSISIISHCFFPAFSVVILSTLFIHVHMHVYRWCEGCIIV